MGMEPGSKRLRTWRKTLQEHNLRYTQARKAVMETLAGCERPLTAQEIHDRARNAGYTLGIASVYRTLEILSEFDLVQHIHHPQGCEAFGPTPAGHKHFLICTKCDRMVDFPGKDDLEDFFHKVGQERGYEVQDHWLQLFGVCQACQNIQA